MPDNPKPEIILNLKTAHRSVQNIRVRATEAELDQVAIELLRTAASILERAIGILNQGHEVEKR